MEISSEIHRDLTMVFSSLALFNLLGAVVSRVLLNFMNPVERCRLENHFRSTESLQWKWKNTFISLIHSVMTGFGAVACFYSLPEMATDLINVYSTLAQNLLAISLGYFVYDSLDMLRFQRTRQSFELLTHHFVIVICFGIAVVSHKFIGYAIVALLVEINSIFLHTRQLMRLSGISKNSTIYRLNGLLNINTYIIFRITTLAWMTRWVIINREAIPFIFYTIGSIGLAIITLMSIILFLRLIQSDFSFGKKKAVSIP